jgi:hypothetical protein
MDDGRINFTIRILPELRTKLRFAHAQTGRTMEQLAEEALTELCGKVLHQENRISGRTPGRVEEVENDSRCYRGERRT